MAVVKVAMLCVAAALMCAAIKVQKPEMSMALSLAAGTLALVWSLDYIREAVEGLQALAGGAGLENGAMGVMLKAAGVALLTEFAQQLCRDAGESALAGRVELCGRAALLAMSVPLLSGLVARLSQLLPQ